MTQGKFTFEFDLTCYSDNELEMAIALRMWLVLSTGWAYDWHLGWD